MATITNKLTPTEAASAADAVYALKDNIGVDRIFKPLDIYNDFEFSKSSKIITAKTGAFEFKSRTGFGVIAKGKGKYERDAIIVCRGTASIYDGLTDINTGIQMSLTGYKVHAGFNRTFNDFSKDIIRFINQHQPRTIHCVGHSLGGALATLSADLVLRKGKQAALYTFGSPRVGQQDFATNLSLNNRMGIENIHRVYHAGDPVAMVPLWPFIHAPQPGGECYIGKFLEFNPMQHKMDNYIKSVKGQSWKSLTRPQPNWDSHIIEWVTSDKTGVFRGLNLYNLTMAVQAIKLAIKEVIGSAMAPIGLLAVAGVTMIDQLSLLLDKAARLSKDAESLVMRIMKRILAMCGIKIKQGQTLTHTFIRMVLNTLTRALNRSVSLAMQVGRLAV